MNIGIVSQKGGIGKSQTCLLLHEALRQAGRTVRVHDWNSEQGTITQSLTRIYGKAPLLVGQFDYTIWDTPPSLTDTATAAAVANAHVVLIIASPEPADVWTVSPTIEFVVRKNPEAIVRVLFNKVQKGRVLGRLVEEHAKSFGVPALPVMLSVHECYKHAIAQGWNALSSGARVETVQFALAVLSLVAS